MARSPKNAHGLMQLVPDRVARRLVGANPPATLAEARTRLDRFAPAETRDYVRRVLDRLAGYGGDGLALVEAGWRQSLATP